MLRLLDDISNIFDFKSATNLKENLGVKLGIGLVTVIVIILLLPSYKSIDTEYEVGTIWASEDLIAPFSFPVYRDDKDYQSEVDEVKKNSSPVFDRAVVNTNNEDVLNLIREMKSVFASAARLELAGAGGINSNEIRQSRDELGLELSQEEWQKLFALYKNELGDSVLTSFNSYTELLTDAIEKVSVEKIINIPKREISSESISVSQEDKENIQDVIPLAEVKDVNDVVIEVRNELSRKIGDNDILIASEEIARKKVKPNLVYNEDLTNLEVENRIRQIQRTIGIVRENERIISKHDPITAEAKLKLDSYKKIRFERLGVQDYFVQFIGKSLTVLILISILTLFLYYIRREVFNNNLHLTLIASLLILQSFFAYVSLNLNINQPVELLIFTAVASILLTIIFDSRLAYYASVIICFLIAAVRGGDYTIAFISFCGMVLAIFSVRDIKNRSQIFRSFFFILVGNTIAILAIGLDRTEESSKIINQLLFGGINAIMSPVIAFGLLIFYERVFKITTDLTLLELSDFNHPLLKQLSSKAPGTFHHSIMMGNLSEAAAEAIGANSILARVGCYYHDIGKINKPEYFIENQLDKNNRHETLKPNASAKIIISHVKDGIDLAKKYNLPNEIVNFIPQHHGTTLVSYFYDKALNQTDLFKETVEDYIYRYPGPKPQTKEAGIMMLADSVEAVSRTIEDPTLQKLETKIIEIIRQRFMEGELDECELTLRDLTKIKQSFLKVLAGVHHYRIKYPDQLKEEQSQKEIEI